MLCPRGIALGFSSSLFDLSLNNLLEYHSIRTSRLRSVVVCALSVLLSLGGRF